MPSKSRQPVARTDMCLKETHAFRSTLYAMAMTRPLVIAPLAIVLIHTSSTQVNAFSLMATAEISLEHSLVMVSACLSTADAILSTRTMVDASHVLLILSSTRQMEIVTIMSNALRLIVNIKKLMVHVELLTPNAPAGKQTVPVLVAPVGMNSMVREFAVYNSTTWLILCASLTINNIANCLIDWISVRSARVVIQSQRMPMVETTIILNARSPDYQ